jgi:putative ABC transport system permease protein
MRTFWRDVRLGTRQLAKTPGFAAVAIVALALAIGANTTVFSLVDALFVRPLLVPDAEAIVHVYHAARDRPEPLMLSLPDATYYRAHARTFSGLAAHYPSSPLHAIVRREPLQVTGSVVTVNYFNVLEIRPEHGRFFRPDEDDAADAHPVAIVSDALWRRRLHADPSAVGEVLQLNGRAFTIVGVAPEGFAGVLAGGSATDIWIPSSMFRVGYRYCNAFQRGCDVIQMVGRLGRGVRLSDARSEMSVLAGQLAAAFPETNRDRTAMVVAARGTTPDRQAASAPVVRILVTVAGLVLVIACANLAGLLLARGLRRRREMAIRLALGAGRRRLVGQLLAESAVLSVCGGAAGLLVAFWAKSLVLMFYAADYAGRPANFTLEISPIVFGATVAVTLGAGVAFGLLPAVLSTRSSVVTALKNQSAGGGTRRTTLRDGLVVGQIALSLVLVVGAGLLVRSLLSVYGGAGFDPRPVLLLRLRPSLVGYSSIKARAFQEAAIQRIESLPGVLAASPCDFLPVLGWGQRVLVSRGAGSPGATGVTSSRVGARYFETLGLRMLEGREFDDRDRANSRPVVIVNDVLARQLWPLDRATGRTIDIDGGIYEVAGVVSDARYHTLAEPPQPYLYRNYWQPNAGGAFADDSRTHVRVAGDPRAMLARIRRELAAVDPHVPISEDYPLVDRLSYEFQPLRVAMVLLLCLGALALVLSAIGVYSVVATAASHRTREMAIRMALGATRGNVGGLLVRQAARLAIGGVAVGLSAALASAHFLAALLYGVHASDLVSFAVAPIVLVAVTLLASYVPARRLMRVEPTEALRAD